MKKAQFLIGSLVLCKLAGGAALVENVLAPFK